MVLGILAAAIILALNPARRNRQARDSTRKADVGQVASALKAYYTAANGFPPPSGPGSNSGLTALTFTGDLKNAPKDPGGVGYQYLISGSGVNSEAAFYATLEEPTSGLGDWLWCFRSNVFKIDEVTAGGCTV